MKDYKTAILPVVAVGCLGIAAITGHPVSQNVQDEVATIGSIAVGAAIAIWGVIKNHKKG